MKKISLVFITIVFFLLSSCSSRIQDVATLIDKPKPSENFLKGSWEIDDIEFTTDDVKDSNYKIGDKLYISNDIVAIEDDYTLNPKFSAKFVNLKDYLISRDFENLEKFANNDINVKILNAQEGQLYSKDFIQLDENLIAFIQNSVIYYLTKTSDKVDESVIEEYRQLQKNIRNYGSDSKNYKKDLTVFLGVRERLEDENQVDKEYEYFTYAIRFEPDSRVRIHKIKNILFPKKQEFWKLRVPKDEDTGYYNKIISYPTRLEKEFSKNPDKEKKYTYRDDSLDLRINYIEENYISYDYTIIDSDFSVMKYAMIKHDELDTGKKLNVNEITGADTLGDFEDRVFEQAKKDNGDIKKEDVDVDSTNIGIIRNQGLWQLVTSYQASIDDKIQQRAFPIDFTIEGKRLNNKKNAVSWDQIKNKNAQAKDYFESYNNQYIIIQDADEILFYELNNGVIGNSPIASIQIKYRTQIIMCEWAGGDYAKKWEDAFLKNDAVHEY
ncbi:MAG: hypothetical protein Q4B52_01970 [Tissierellia bacterium]|nr:hypothetical protein [Tissierellia bacterium]